jgi:hypothetical protein
MEVYILFKHYKSRHDSQFPTAHYFTPQNFVLMLKMCTSNGALEEFKLLNRDVMMIEKVDDEYVAKIKQGYSNFISRGQEEKVVEQRKITITTSQENLEMIKSLLVSCLQ